MISKQDILERAREWQLRPEVVEKDYVLGWLLAAIALEFLEERSLRAGCAWSLLRIPLGLPHSEAQGFPGIADLLGD